MKTKRIAFIIIGFVFVLAACKKDNLHAATGRWQETEVRIWQDSAGVVLHDTSYFGSTFTQQDYVLFNGDGTCVISSSHDYYPAAMGNPRIPPFNLSAATLNVRALGPAYVLTPVNNLVNPGGFFATDTAEVQNPHNMIVHVVSYGPGGPYEFRDDYYKK